jgi:hypothetical protein
MEEISGQTTRILKLAEEQNKIWEEQSLKQESKGGSGATKDSPKFTS